MNGLMEKSLLEIEREPLNRQDVEQQIEEGRVLENDEKPTTLPTPAAPEHEHTVPTRKKLVALLGYFLCNVGLTLYNKAVLGKVSHSPMLSLSKLSLGSLYQVRSSPVSCTVSFSMALDGYPCGHILYRLSHTTLAGPLPHD